MTFVRIALWTVLTALVLLAVVAAFVRTVHVGDASVRLERARLQMTPSIPLVPDPAARMREVSDFDRQYSRHPVAARFHVIPGASFLVLALLQFAGPIRRRYRVFHRWTGRLLLVFGGLTVASALFFGIFMSFAGRGETVGVTLAAGILLVSLVRAVVAIRSGDVARHREWMIRAVAVMIGITIIRLVGALLDVALTPAGFSVPRVLAISLWAGWALTLAVAETWIRASRDTPVAEMSIA